MFVGTGARVLVGGGAEVFVEVGGSTCVAVGDGTGACVFVGAGEAGGSRLGGMIGGRVMVGMCVLTG